MEVKPPGWLERVVASALPPDARECVMGDLLERFRAAPPETASRQFLADAVSILPAAMTSRLRRAVGWRLWWSETALLLVLFTVSAFSVPWISGTTFLIRQGGMVRLLVPVLITLLSMTWRDIYGSLRARDAWQHLGLVGGALVVSLLVNGAVGVLAAPWQVPGGMMAWASCMTFALVSTLRWSLQRTAPMRRQPPLWLGEVMSLVMVIFSVSMVLAARDPLIRIGAGMTVAGGLWAAWQGHADRRRGRRSPARRLLRIAALLPGAILGSVGPAIAHPSILPAALTWILGLLAIGVLPRIRVIHP